MRKADPTDAGSLWVELQHQWDSGGSPCFGAFEVRALLFLKHKPRFFSTRRKAIASAGRNGEEAPRYWSGTKRPRRWSLAGDSLGRVIERNLFQSFFRRIKGMFDKPAPAARVLSLSESLEALSRQAESLDPHGPIVAWGRQALEISSEEERP
jgi:hypothetical protein